MRGCDGERVYYGVHSLIAINGNVVAISKQFDLKEIVSHAVIFFFVYRLVGLCLYKYAYFLEYVLKNHN